MTTQNPAWRQPLPEFRDPPPAKEHAVTCVECGSPMRLRYSDQYARHFYGCSRYPVCEGIHGAHPDGAPLGVPGDKETRQARREAHAAFDDLWRSGDVGVNRGQAYALMNRELGFQHIGELTKEQCEQVCEWVRDCYRFLDQPPREEIDDDH